MDANGSSLRVHWNRDISMIVGENLTKSNFSLLPDDQRLWSLLGPLLLHSLWRACPGRSLCRGENVQNIYMHRIEKPTLSQI